MTTINFGTAVPPPDGGLTNYPSGLTLSGVTFTSLTGGGIAIVSQNLYGAAYARGYDALDGYPAGMDVTLPSGVNALGFLLFTVNNGDNSGATTDNVDITFGGQTFTVSTAPAPTAVLVGFVDTSAISTVSIIPEAAANDTVRTDIMNFSFGNTTPSTVPEPGTVRLSAASLLLISFIKIARDGSTKRRLVCGAAPCRAVIRKYP